MKKIMSVLCAAAMIFSVASINSVVYAENSETEFKGEDGNIYAYHISRWGAVI